jgi:hypothetical protein
MFFFNTGELETTRLFLKGNKMNNDRTIFRRTAGTTKAINVKPKLYRGGTRL